MRPFDRVVPLDYTRFVRSGDTLAVLKLDGLDQLIAWGKPCLFSEVCTRGFFWSLRLLD
jgi:hypothetical protein